MAQNIITSSARLNLEIDDQFELEINRPRTELYLALQVIKVNNNLNLQIISNLVVDKLLWQQDSNLSSDEIFPVTIGEVCLTVTFVGWPNTEYHQVYVTEDSDLFLLTADNKVLNSHNNQAIVQAQEPQYDIISIEDWQVSNFDLSFQLPRANLELVTVPKEGDTLTINGYTLTFTGTPTRINHVLLTGYKNEVFANLKKKLQVEITDLRLEVERLDYIFDDKNYTLTIQARNLDPKWLLFSTDSSNSERLTWDNPFLTGYWFENRLVVTNRQGDNSFYEREQLPIQVDFDNILFLGLEYTWFSNQPEQWWEFTESVITGRVANNYGSITDLFFLGEGEVKLWQPVNTYKLFRFDFIEPIIWGEDDQNYLTLDIRYSLDNRRSWSPWLRIDRQTGAPRERIRTNTTRYFYIEYRFTRIGNDRSKVIVVYDVILNGEVDNVSCNYLSLKRFGIRDCCGRPKPQPCQDGSCYPEAQSYLSNPPLSPADLSTVSPEKCDGCEQRFNPYSISLAQDLHAKVSKVFNDIYGHEVDYIRVDPEASSGDIILHEYSLKNAVKVAKLKVVVPDNQFPEENVSFNIFDMGLLDSWEIHILRDEFRAVFGITERPQKDDIIFFCIINQLYQVEFAYPYSTFMNNSIYYKVYLYKYQDKKNIRHQDPEAADLLKNLTEFNSIETLFSEETEIQTLETVRPELFQPWNKLKVPVVRHPNINIENQELTNQGFKVSDYNYNLKKVKTKERALFYKMYEIDKSYNGLTFFFWLKVNTMPKNRWLSILEVKINDEVLKLDLNNRVWRLNWLAESDTLTLKKWDLEQWQVIAVTIDSLGRQVKLSHWQQERNDPRNRLNTKLKELNRFTLPPADSLVVDRVQEIIFYAANYQITSLIVANTELNDKELTEWFNSVLRSKQEELVIADLADPIYDFPTQGGLPNAYTPPGPASDF